MTWTLAIASTMLSFTGMIVGYRVARLADDRLDTWRRREESLRLLRWAVELCHTEDSEQHRTGLAVLSSLEDTDLLQVQDVTFVTAISLSLAARRTTHHGQTTPNKPERT